MRLQKTMCNKVFVELNEFSEWIASIENGGANDVHASVYSSENILHKSSGVPIKYTTSFQAN